MRLLPEIVDSASSIQAIRRDIHVYSKLRFEEICTAELVAEALINWGIPIVRGLDKTGVVSRIDGDAVSYRQDQQSDS